MQLNMKVWSTFFYLSVAIILEAIQCLGNEVYHDEFSSEVLNNTNTNLEGKENVLHKYTVATQLSKLNKTKSRSFYNEEKVTKSIPTSTKKKLLSRADRNSKHLILENYSPSEFLTVTKENLHAPLIEHFKSQENTMKIQPTETNKYVKKYQVNLDPTDDYSAIVDNQKVQNISEDNEYNVTSGLSDDNPIPTAMLQTENINSSTTEYYEFHNSIYDKINLNYTVNQSNSEIKLTNNWNNFNGAKHNNSNNSTNYNKTLISSKTSLKRRGYESDYSESAESRTNNPKLHIKNNYIFQETKDMNINSKIHDDNESNLKPKINIQDSSENLVTSDIHHNNIIYENIINELSGDISNFDNSLFTYTSKENNENIQPFFQNMLPSNSVEKNIYNEYMNSETLNLNNLQYNQLSEENIILVDSEEHVSPRKIRPRHLISNLKIPEVKTAHFTKLGKDPIHVTSSLNIPEFKTAHFPEIKKDPLHVTSNLNKLKLKTAHFPKFDKDPKHKTSNLNIPEFKTAHFPKIEKDPLHVSSNLNIPEFKTAHFPEIEKDSIHVTSNFNIPEFKTAHFPEIEKDPLHMSSNLNTPEFKAAHFPEIEKEPIHVSSNLNIPEFKTAHFPEIEKNPIPVTSNSNTEGKKIHLPELGKGLHGCHEVLQKKLQPKEMTEEERAERLNNAIERFIQIVSIIGQVDSYITDKARNAIRKLAIIYDDDGRGPLPRFRKRLF